MFNTLVSIIVRTKNEYFWIGKCLNEIYNQDYKNFEERGDHFIKLAMSSND